MDGLTLLDHKGFGHPTPIDLLTVDDGRLPINAIGDARGFESAVRRSMGRNGARVLGRTLRTGAGGHLVEFVGVLRFLAHRA